MAQLIIITTTSHDRDVLERIAHRLVAGKMAACCQITQPITSIYRWDGEVESALEFELKIKTLADRFGVVADLIATMHNYDVPQVVAVEIAQVTPAYADWVQANVE